MNQATLAAIRARAADLRRMVATTGSDEFSTDAVSLVNVADMLDDLMAEIERLGPDSDRIDWIADCSHVADESDRVRRRASFRSLVDTLRGKPRGANGE